MWTLAYECKTNHCLAFGINSVWKKKNKVLLSDFASPPLVLSILAPFGYLNLTEMVWNCLLVSGGNVIGWPYFSEIQVWCNSGKSDAILACAHTPLDFIIITVHNVFIGLIFWVPLGHVQSFPLPCLLWMRPGHLYSFKSIIHVFMCTHKYAYT